MTTYKIPKAAVDAFHEAVVAGCSYEEIMRAALPHILGEPVGEVKMHVSPHGVPSYPVFDCISPAKVCHAYPVGTKFYALAQEDSNV